jgi:hypothetical protein
LPAGDGEVGWVFVQPKRLAPSAFAGLGDEAGDARRLWIVESLTQTLSLGDRRLKVVLMQATSSARATLDIASSGAAHITTSLMLCISIWMAPV